MAKPTAGGQDREGSVAEPTAGGQDKEVSGITAEPSTASAGDVKEMPLPYMTAAEFGPGPGTNPAQAGPTRT